jgi:hypothetical protein
MPARYAALPNPRSIPDTERELDDAFGSANDDNNDTESTPLVGSNPQSASPGDVAPSRVGGQTSIPGTYDFEREYSYDLPPPGSPPRPSTFALPNDIGNSNGLLPTSPIRRKPMPRLSLFRRLVGAVLPTHYMPVPSGPTGGVVGGGLENDGVFANVTAKPQRAREVHTESGDVYLVPEDSQKDIPPVRTPVFIVV